MRRMFENKELISLLQKLKRQKKPFWAKVHYELSKPRRKRLPVNVDKLAKHVPDGCVVVVPGKVLGRGKINKKIKIAAFSFSEKAREIIRESGGEAMSIEKLLEINPEAKNVMIIK